MSGQASQSTGTPQHGAPELQMPLTDEQKAMIRKWGSEGMHPDSLSTVFQLSMQGHMPETVIEAYMRTDEYRSHVRDMPTAFVP
jgi:hypothetical protein